MTDRITAAEARRLLDAAKALVHSDDCTFGEGFDDCRCGATMRAERAQLRLEDAAPALAAALIAVTEERDRLARILAVERGDASAAPDGWCCLSPRHLWGRGNGFRVRRRLDGVWGWVNDCADGEADSALEAMEAADAAGKETT